MARGLLYQDNIREFVTQLDRAGVALQEAAADTLNLCAKWIKLKYQANLKDRFTLRAPRFTLGAVQIHEAHARHSKSPELRKLRDINAIVGVITMSQGRLHYLAKQETGATVKGMRKLGGRVPIPLVAARQGGMLSKPIAAKYRIDKAQIVNSRGYLDKLNPRRQYAAMRWMAKHGRLDPKKLYLTNTGIYKVGKKQIIRLRDSDETKVIIKAVPNFERAVDSLSPARIEQAFIITARRLLKENS